MASSFSFHFDVDGSGAQHSCAKDARAASLQQETFAPAEEVFDSNDDTRLTDQLDDRNTDLVAGTYEGGLKVWECTVDLVAHLRRQHQRMDGKRALDVGCGHGIVGACAINLGARCDFQDYNRQVLESATIPRIAAFDAGSRFFAGDWLALCDYAPWGDDTYDVIMTAETLYAIDSMPRLLALLKRRMAKPSGVAYVASKTYYFGVGGGTRQFEDLVREDGAMSSTVVWTTPGEGVKREILMLQWVG